MLCLCCAYAKRFMKNDEERRQYRCILGIVTLSVHLVQAASLELHAVCIYIIIVFFKE